MAKWMHLTFCVIWLVTAVVFFVIGLDALGSIGTTLPRFQYAPVNPDVQVGMAGINPISEFNYIGRLFNESVDQLQASIRHSARLTVTLNGISFIAALFGLFAQIGAYIRECRPAHKDRNPQPEGAVPPSGLSKAEVDQRQIQAAEAKTG
jgi:hypothetical protein